MYTTTRDGVTEYHMNTYTYEPKNYTTAADLLAADRRAADDIAQLIACGQRFTRKTTKWSF